MSQSPEAQSYQIDNFVFEDGSTLPSVNVAYLDINPTAKKTALIVSCFRGRLNTTLNFSEGALRDHRIIVAALLGNGESASPSNTANFPKSIDYRDCVRAQHKLLTSHLGIHELDVVVGFSMGGQCTYHWTLMHPEMVPRAVIICSSARTSRHNYQFLEGPKAALENSIDFADRDISNSQAKPQRGLRAFGKVYSAWLTSAEWFDQELYKTLGYETLDAWDHEVAGTNYYDWNADDLLAKLNMWQKGDITVFGGSEKEKTLEEALARIKARVLLMPCRTDQYFRWEASEREAKHIPDVTLKVIPSMWGHLAGLGISKEDLAFMDGAITELLAETPMKK